MPNQLDRLKAALANRYAIDREIGRGGMATVYLAHDLRHDRAVALKVLRPELSASVGTDRFLREIKLAASLNHPNILALYDSGEVEDFLFYVMPVAEGDSLHERLRTERQLPIDEALQIAKEAAEGIDYAHERGVIHRDIKPENILLYRGHVLIADFGIGKALAESEAGSLTSTGTFVGTPLYMSPEQAAGDPGIDGRSDVYSLGCVVYEMLAGEPPFTGPTIQALMAKHAVEARPSVRTLRDTVPESVDAALSRAIARVPADRYRTAREFAAALTTLTEPARRGPYSGDGRSGAGALEVATLRQGRRPRDDEIEAYGMSHAGNVDGGNTDLFFIYSLRRRVESHISNLPADHVADLEAERIAYLAMVADGLGAGPNRQDASALAAEIVTDYVTRSVHCCYTNDLHDEQRFVAALQQAAERCHAELQGKGLLNGLGPSLALYIGVWPKTYLLQVGSACCYIARRGVLTRLPEADPAPADRWKPRVFRYEQDWGLVGLLCTDGLTRHVSDDRILHRLETMETPKQGCESLIRDAVDGGGQDSVTVVIGRTVMKGGY